MMKLNIIALILSLTLLSCKKEELKPTPNNKNFEISNRQISVFKDSLFETSTSFGCRPPNIDCYPTVAITGLSVPIMNGIFTTVIEGNQSQIRSSFSNNQEFLTTYLNINDIQKVINGEFFVFGKGANTATRYFILKTANTNTLKLVYPFN